MGCVRALIAPGRRQTQAARIDSGGVCVSSTSRDSSKKPPQIALPWYFLISRPGESSSTMAISPTKSTTQLNVRCCSKRDDFEQRWKRIRKTFGEESTFSWWRVSNGAQKWSEKALTALDSGLHAAFLLKVRNSDVVCKSHTLISKLFVNFGETTTRAYLAT